MTHRLRVDGLQQPRPDRFGPDEPAFLAAMDSHAVAMDAGQAGYLDPSNGLFVLTSGYLAARGSCCDSGCRHCPYTVSGT
ncbi:MAG: DUF5522 domain-containing protein [Acidimicrobiales bacterium]